MGAIKNPHTHLRYSLLVPCYNAEKYIDKFVSNINALQRPFDEIIFYDDCSTDRTYQIISSFGYSVLKGEINRGAGFARNQLSKAATGNYIHFHDIDDFLSPDYLSKTAEIAEKTGCDVILCNVDWFNEEQQLLISWKYSNVLIQENPIIYTISNPIGGINGLYLRSKFEETGGFNETFRIWEDADLHVKLAASLAQFYIIEEVLSYSIRYPTSASADQRCGWRSRLFFLTEYAERFKAKELLLVVGEQAQIAASQLIIYQQVQEARAALELSESCGLKIPNNRSFIWKILKTLMPRSMRINVRLAQLKNAFTTS